MSPVKHNSLPESDSSKESSASDPNQNEEKPGQDGTSSSFEESPEILQNFNIPTPDFKIKLNLPIKGASGGDNSQLGELLEEMAEDMLHLMEQTARMERTLSTVSSLAEQIRHTQDQYHRHQIVELEKLRKDMLSERKALVARSTFNAILPAMESLILTRGALDAEIDPVVVNQLTAVIGTLNNISQSLGYSSFEVLPGEDFDPVSMECFGYQEGNPGTVVRVERVGYRTAEAVIRPCGVILGHLKENG